MTKGYQHFPKVTILVIHSLEVTILAMADR